MNRDVAIYLFSYYTYEKYVEIDAKKCSQDKVVRLLLLEPCFNRLNAFLADG